MPRTYVRKGKSYSTADLRGALNLIRDGKLTVKAALEQYHIPAATIYSRLSGLRGEGKPGAKTILSTDEEEFLIHVIHKYQEWQQPLTRSDLISIARTYMIELKKKNINNDSSLREWFFCFRQRWQNVIKLVQAYKLENIRSVSCTQTVVDRWFDHLEKVLTKLNLFDRPQSIYNVDETGFGDDPGRRQIAELFKNHLLPAHCAGGFAKAGIYPFDKRVISKEKLLLSATASECNKSISESNTTDDIRDTSLTTTVVSHLQRTSSCPNFSSSDLPLISTHHTPSTSNNLGTSSGTVTSISSISTSDLDNISSTTTAISTFTPNTSTSSIFSAGMEVLYSNLDEPAFPESIYLQTAPSPNTASSHTNSTSRKNNNDNSWNFEGGTQTDKVENAQSSSISAANLGLSNRTALNAITAAINNHMKPTIMAINRRKKQVDRPYGESITSVDAYIKLSNKENARKRKSTKESAKANSKEKK
ncbi:unnamed protein product, partial [Rotaria sordida]